MAEYIFHADPIGAGLYQYTLIGELVRCEDCKWYRFAECRNKNGLVVACDDGYCKYGERRADDGNL